jgi:hypothetical protein
MKCENPSAAVHSYHFPEGNGSNYAPLNLPGLCLPWQQWRNTFRRWRPRWGTLLLFPEFWQIKKGPEPQWSLVRTQGFISVRGVWKNMFWIQPVLNRRQLTPQLKTL